MSLLAESSCWPLSLTFQWTLIFKAFLQAKSHKLLCHCLSPAYNAFLNKVQTIPVVYVPTIGPTQPGKDCPPSFPVHVCLSHSPAFTILLFFSRFLYSHLFSPSLPELTATTSAESATTLAVEYKTLT